jgi:DNA repair exonuclease SbcCD ATPase subunit
MILRLSNFRTHKKSEYILGERGISLISGPSGVGKSSLLMAIQYALFGKLKRVVRIGEKKCEVEVVFPETFFAGIPTHQRISRILRRSNPHLLKVFANASDELQWIEGVEAQEKINVLFGENFDVTGYIAQDPDKSFMLKRAGDKFEFLEAFAFKDSNIYKIKKYAKDLVAQRNNELVAAQALARDATAVFESLKKPVEIPFPKKCSVANYAVVEKNARIRVETGKRSIAAKTKEMQAVREHESAVAVLEAEMKSARQNLESAHSAHAKTLEELDAVKYAGDEALQEMEVELAALRSDATDAELRARLERDSASLRSMEKCERERLQTERDEIKSAVWSEMSRAEVVEMIEEFKVVLADKKRMGELRRRETEYASALEKAETNLSKLCSKLGEGEASAAIEKLSRSLALRREKIKNHTKVYSCPSCLSKLRINEESLEEVVPGEEDGIEDIQRAEAEVEREEGLEKELRRAEERQKSAAERVSLVGAEIESVRGKYKEKEFDLEGGGADLEEDLKTSEEYLREHDAMQRRVEEVESALREARYSASFVKLRKEVEGLKVKVHALPPRVVGRGGEDAIREITEKIGEERSRRAIMRSARAREIKERVRVEESRACIAEMENKRAEMQEKSERIGRGGGVSQLMEEIGGCEKVVSENEEMLRKIGVYNLSRNQVQEYENQRKRREERVQEVERALGAWTTAKTLQGKIKDAEYLALQNVVSAINAHAEWYLDRFFPEDGISVVLKTSRESGSGTGASKSAIEVDIQYKGAETELEMLSGGERARVMLAYTLALGELFAVPMLMLDECTASLDQETTSLVVEAVRESYFATRLILVVAHQCVSGIFDIEVCV